MAATRHITLDTPDSPRRPLRVLRRRWAAREFAMVIMRGAFIALLAMLAYSIKASAAEASARLVQSLPTIRMAVEQFVHATALSQLPAGASNSTKLSITVSEPDARLQLADCGDELRAFTLNGAAIAGRNTIGIRCTDESRGAWTLYLSVAVEVEQSVLVLRHSLARDAHVGADDVEIQTRRVPGIGAGYPNDLIAVRDQHLKRGAPAGSLLSSDLLTRDLMIKRGQEVFLVFDVGGIAIHAPGLALADAGFADRVRVQNRTSLKVVEGTVESGNLVRVGL